MHTSLPQPLAHRDVKVASFFLHCPPSFLFLLLVYTCIYTYSQLTCFLLTPVMSWFSWTLAVRLQQPAPSLTGTCTSVVCSHYHTGPPMQTRGPCTTGAVCTDLHCSVQVGHCRLLPTFTSCVPPSPEHPSCLKYPRNAPSLPAQTCGLWGAVSMLLPSDRVHLMALLLQP